jgi:hypothetical protein
LIEINSRGQPPDMKRMLGGSHMRFFFNIRDKLEIQDEVGREFAIVSEAIVFAKQLAADMRCLETRVRPSFAIEVVAENAERIHREAVFA